MSDTKRITREDFYGVVDAHAAMPYLKRQFRSRENVTVAEEQEPCGMMGCCITGDWNHCCSALL